MRKIEITDVAAKISYNSTPKTCLVEDELIGKLMGPSKATPVGNWWCMYGIIQFIFPREVELQEW